MNDSIYFLVLHIVFFFIFNYYSYEHQWQYICSGRHAVKDRLKEVFLVISLIVSYMYSDHTYIYKITSFTDKYLKLSVQLYVYFLLSVGI